MIKKLGTAISEYSVRNKLDEEIPVYSVTNEQGFCTGYFSKDVASKDRTTYKIVPYGYFAYNPSRINVGSVDWQHSEERVIVSPLYVVFGVDESVDKRYLLHYLKSDIARMLIKNYASGSVRDNLKLSTLMEFPFNFRSLEEQKEIANVLDKIDYLIGVQKQRMDYFDRLVKSRFIELFGDPVSATKEEKVELLELCEKITDGEHGSVARISEGHPFLNAKHILKNGNIDWDTITFIGELEHQRIYKRCNPEPGDILLTTTGTIGNVAIMPECEEVSMDRGITLLKINHEKVTSEFVAELLRQDSVQIEMRANVHASAIGHLFMNKVKKLPAILPAMDRQMEFTKFVKQTDKSKYYSQKFLTLCRLAVNIYEQEWMKCQTLNF